MSTKKKRHSEDKIFVKGGGGSAKAGPSSVPTANHDDVTLLALQISCPQRWEPDKHQKFDSIHEIQNLVAITVETKQFSSLIVLGSNSSKNIYTDIAANLSKQLHSIIKSALEKIYFIESFQLVDPSQLDWDFFVKMSDYCFMQETSKGPVFISYFRLEKTNDEERFESRAVSSLVDGEVAEQDIYLFFKKNNRYIKIAKKGDALEKQKMDRLSSGGVTDLYMTSDQGVENQQRRVRHILLELQEDYSTMINAG